MSPVSNGACASLRRSSPSSAFRGDSQKLQGPGPFRSSGSSRGVWGKSTPERKGSAWFATPESPESDSEGCATLRGLGLGQALAGRAPAGRGGRVVGRRLRAAQAPRGGLAEGGVGAVRLQSKGGGATRCDATRRDATRRDAGRASTGEDRRGEARRGEAKYKRRTRQTINNTICHDSSLIESIPFKSTSVATIN